MAKKKGRRKLKPQQLNLTRLTIPGAGENVGEPGLLSHGRQEPDTHGHSGKWRGGFSQSEAYTFRVPRECSPQLHSSRSSTGNLKNVRPPTGRSTRHVGSTLPCTSTGRQHERTPDAPHSGEDSSRKKPHAGLRSRDFSRKAKLQ